MTDPALSETNPEHYLDRLVAAGDKAGLTTNQPVMDRNGMVLAGPGTPVSARLRERLVRHKLLRPIDESLSSTDPVTPERLVERARTLLADNPLLQRLARQVPDSGRLLSAIRSVELPQPLEIKLTVAAANEPARLDHLLMVTLTALAIGLRHGMPAGELKALALAGILHDLGELHIDPAIFESSGDLSVALRRQVEAHPVIMYAMLESLGDRYHEAARAILEHHERIDGSGYPRGRHGKQLSSPGRILALAEFLASLHMRRECTHMLVALKLQRHHFDPELVEIAFRLMGRPSSATPEHAGRTFAELTARLTALLTVPREWRDLRDRDDELGLSADHLNWLDDRARTIQHHFARLGVHADDLEGSLAPIAEDDEAIAELTIITEEIERQIVDTTWEVHRRVGPAAIERLPDGVRELLTRPVDVGTPAPR